MPMDLVSSVPHAIPETMADVPRNPVQYAGDTLSQVAIRPRLPANLWRDRSLWVRTKPREIALANVP
jgi:hypothetical protein